MIMMERGTKSLAKVVGKRQSTCDLAVFILNYSFLQFSLENLQDLIIRKQM
jgi:hypothetical protein